MLTPDMAEWWSLHKDSLWGKAQSVGAFIAVYVFLRAFGIKALIVAGAVGVAVLKINSDKRRREGERELQRQQALAESHDDLPARGA